MRPSNMHSHKKQFFNLQIIASNDGTHVTAPFQILKKLFMVHTVEIVQFFFFKKMDRRNIS